MTAFPTLTTPRLLLRQLTPDDAEALFSIFSDPRAMQFWFEPPHKTVAQTRASLAYAGRNLRAPEWAVVLRDTSQVIGTVNFIDATVAGMGYIIHPDYWQQGYGFEAATAAVDYGFTRLRLNRIELWILAKNIPSQRLAYKLGFRPRAQFYQRYPHRTELHETIVFGLRAEEWATQQGRPNELPSSIAFYSIHPVIHTATMAATLHFYQQQLGFDLSYVDREPPTFAILSRGEWSFERAELHIISSPTRAPAGELYFLIGMSADHLHDEFTAKGVSIALPLETKPYGRREFQITDPNGWRLTFSSAI